MQAPVVDREEATLVLTAAATTNSHAQAAPGGTRNLPLFLSL